MAETGHLTVAEGALFYTYTAGQPTQPPLVFSHAGVANHSMWDEQVAYFSARGHACVTYDRFGFGASEPSREFLAQSPRPPVDFDAHLLCIVDHFFPDAKVVAIGLSMGGNQSLQFAVSHPDRVLGAASLAGGLSGFGHPNEPDEDAMFDVADGYITQKLPEEAARMQVRIWGDGTRAQPGRMDRAIADKMLAWNVDIANKEIAGVGGGALRPVPIKPRVLDSFDTINVPIAVAWGTYDETNTSEAMKLVGREVKGVTIREFPAAHMINLEMPDQVNAWLNDWLTANFK